MLYVNQGGKGEIFCVSTSDILLCQVKGLSREIMPRCYCGVVVCAHSLGGACEWHYVSSYGWKWEAVLINKTTISPIRGPVYPVLTIIHYNTTTMEKNKWIRKTRTFSHGYSTGFLANLYMKEKGEKRKNKLYINSGSINTECIHVNQ